VPRNDEGGVRQNYRSPPPSGGFHFTWPVRVYYEDTDAGGVVYHANYLRFLERARSEWLRALGFEQDDLSARDGVIFAVVAARLEFLKPARFNDLLTVGVKLDRLGRASLELTQAVLRAPDTLLCRADVRLACLDGASFRPRPMPDALLRGLRV
jgi:acyl-CoA thioester hydrolase